MEWIVPLLQTNGDNITILAEQKMLVPGSDAAANRLAGTVENST